MEERLQKLMAQAGLGSRRDCEQFIEAGRVTVNGKVAQLGQKADPARDRILVDGHPIKAPEKLVYIALYKPRGVLSAVSSEDRRPTVRDLVPEPGHLYPVGRLDIDSEGLILLTNDGELANRLTHPRYGHEKEYRVLVARQPDEEQISTWRRGVVLEDGYRTQPAEVAVEGKLGKGAWLRIILREGRKRQIRETGSRLGLPVVKILRVRIGELRLGFLKPREWRYLTPAEVTALKEEPAKNRPTLGREKGPASRAPRQYEAPADRAGAARRPVSPRKPAGAPGAGRPGARPGNRPPRRQGPPESDYAQRPAGTNRPTRPARPGRASGGGAPGRSDRSSGQSSGRPNSPTGPRKPNPRKR